MKQFVQVIPAAILISFNFLLPFNLTDAATIIVTHTTSVRWLISFGYGHGYNDSSHSLMFKIFPVVGYSFSQFYATLTDMGSTVINGQPTRIAFCEGTSDTFCCLWAQRNSFNRITSVSVVFRRLFGWMHQQQRKWVLHAESRCKPTKTLPLFCTFSRFSDLFENYKPKSL